MLDEDRSRTNWTGPHGYGARHKLDDAPFSLWDAEKTDFRLPTDLERKWLISKFKPSSIHFSWPIMVIQTDTPPKPLPLTAGAVPVKFIPSPSFSPSDTERERRMRRLLVDDERPLDWPTGYEGMRGPADPLPTPLRRWISPTDDELTSLVETFQRFCNPRVIYILCPHLIVELHCDDQRTYELRSLPRTVGGYAVHYHHNSTSAFEGLTAPARATKPDPTTQATSPRRRLLGSHEIANGSFFSMDTGMSSTHPMFLMAEGIALDTHKPDTVATTGLSFSKRIIYRRFGPVQDEVPAREEGVFCGVAIVEDDMSTEEGGGVAGLFQEGNASFAFAPALDEIIDRRLQSLV